MEGVGELIDVESKTVSELQGELTEAYKTIAELRNKIALLEKRHLQSEGADYREPEVKLGRKAEEIIPKECWGIVFQNLEVEDLMSCRQVCKTFNQVLDAKQFKVQWKFKLILPLLFPHLKTSESDRKTWEPLSNARLVCRSWRHSIDKYVSEVRGTGFLPILRPSEMPLATCFRTFADIEEFQERFGECKTNPFPSRSVCFLSNPDEDAIEDTHKAYIEKVGYLLVQFGKNIFRLRLGLFNYEEHIGPDPLTLCKLIKRITIQLPNLKELLIRNEVSDEFNEDDVASYIAENALAALPKLRALNLDGLNLEVEDYLLDAFGPQLTQLETPWSNGPSRFQMKQLNNVRKLYLALNEPDDNLEQLRFLKSPLKFLKLKCKFGTQETWNVDKVLRNLKHLKIELLEIILYDLDKVNVAEAGLDLKEYNNANIKTLIIHIDRPNHDSPNQISFNFLQALTKLENLEFKYGEQLRITHPGELPEVVKLNEYLFGEEETDFHYHSNVWEKVPSLKTFTSGLVQEGDEDVFPFVNKSIFTREKYERFIAERDCPESN